MNVTMDEVERLAGLSDHDLYEGKIPILIKVRLRLRFYDADC